MNTSNSSQTVLAKQGSITFLGKIFSKLVDFSFLIAATRLLTPSEYGAYALALSIVLFTKNIGSLNLHRSIDYFVPQYLDENKPRLAGAVVRTVILLATPISVFVAILVTIATPILIEIFSEPGLQRVLPILSLYLIFRLLHDAIISVFNSIKVLKYRVYLDSIIRPGFKLIIGIGLALLGFGAVGLALGHVLALLVAGLVGFSILITKLPWTITDLGTTVSKRSLFNYSFPLVFSGIILSLVAQIDYFVIGYFMDSSSVGIYRVATLLATNIVIFHASLMPVFKPMIAESINNNTELIGRYRLTTRWVTMFTLPVAVVLISGAEAYLNVLFESEYAAVTSLILIVFGQLLNISLGPAGRTLEGLGWTQLKFLNTIFVLVVNVTLNIILVPRLGITGAAVGTMTTLGLTGVLSLLELVLLKDRNFIYIGTSRIWFAIIPALLVGLILASIQNNKIVVFIIPVGVGLTYLGFLNLFRVFNDQDIEIARKIDEKIGYSIVCRLLLIRSQ